MNIHFLAKPRPAWGAEAIRIYRAVALVGLNTLVLLVAVEVLAWISLAVYQHQSGDPGQDEGICSLPYFAAESWCAAFLYEHGQAESATRYEPFVLWRTAQFEGEHVNVDLNGRRSTHDLGDCASRVFVLGGSAVWGWGVPDWGTIPSYLGAHLAKLDIDACVHNFGENGFVSSQELIKLESELRRGHVPDVVVFYNGFNEMWAAWETRRVGVHFQPEKIASKLEDSVDQRPSLMHQILGGTRTAAVVRALAWRLASPPPVPPSDDNLSPGEEILAMETASVYESNMRIARGLAMEFGFGLVFAWQPYIRAGNKELTQAEQRMRSPDRMMPAFPFFDQVDSIIEARASDIGDLHYLGDVFDAELSDIWIDFVHVSPEGNRLVAERLTEILIAGGRIH